MVQQLGGVVHQAADGGEYGRMGIRASGGSQLYAYDSSEHCVHKESVWMSHGDSIDKLPEGFQPVATSEQVTHDLSTQHSVALATQSKLYWCRLSAQAVPQSDRHAALKRLSMLSHLCQILLLAVHCCWLKAACAKCIPSKQSL